MSIVLFGVLVFGFALTRSGTSGSPRPTDGGLAVSGRSATPSPMPTMTAWDQASQTRGTQPLAAVAAHRIYCTPNAAGPVVSAPHTPRPSAAPTTAPSTAPLSLEQGSGSLRSGQVALAAAPGFSVCVPVLEYHRIVPSAQAGDSLPGLVVSPDVFAAQMTALRNAGWHTITLATLAGDLAARRTPRPKTFVVTIDDGWFDGYTYARPILRATGFVATYFPVSSRIGRTDFLTAAQLRTLIADGDEIGNHTVTHVSLDYLTAAGMKYEVDEASVQIAAATGVRPRSFAYPIGRVDTLSATIVAACPGIGIAVTEVRAIGETYAGRFGVPRLEIGPNVTAAMLLVMIQG